MWTRWFFEWTSINWSNVHANRCLILFSACLLQLKSCMHEINRSESKWNEQRTHYRRCTYLTFAWNSLVAIKNLSVVLHVFRMFTIVLSRESVDNWIKASRNVEQWRTVIILLRENKFFFRCRCCYAYGVEKESLCDRNANLVDLCVCWSLLSRLFRNNWNSLEKRIRLYNVI